METRKKIGIILFYVICISGLVIAEISVHMQLYTGITSHNMLTTHGITTHAIVLKKYTKYTGSGSFRVGSHRHLNFVTYQFSDTKHAVWESRSEIKDATLWETIQEQDSIDIRYLEYQPSLSHIIGNPLYTREEKISIGLGSSVLVMIIVSYLFCLYVFLFHIWDIQEYGGDVFKRFRSWRAKGR